MSEIMSIVVTLVASSGFWAFLTSVQTKKSRKREEELQEATEKYEKLDALMHLQTEMLIGLGHDRVMYLGVSYIERGWITRDEFENLNDYLYEPYTKMGGNGSAKKIMEEVNRLPTKKGYINETNK